MGTGRVFRGSRLSRGLGDHEQERPGEVPELGLADTGDLGEPGLVRRLVGGHLDQGYISGEAEEPMISYVAERFGSERMLFTSDYPHWDGETDPVADFFRIFGDTLSEEDQVNIMCNTSRKLYDIDLNFDEK